MTRLAQTGNPQESTALAASLRALGPGPLAWATDLDRTLTGADLVPDAAALDALQRVRRAGHAVVLVTGRPESEVERTVLSRFDGVVLEGGAVWGTPGHLQRAPGADVALAAARRLHEAGVEVETRTASFSAWVKDSEAVERLAADCQIVRNVDRFDVLPPGHDKSTGLTALLQELDLQGRPLLATGDGENDVALVSRVKLGLAVGNATATLRQHARHVLPGDGPAGIRLVARLLLEPAA